MSGRAEAADTPELRRGDRGPEVSFYQDELNSWLRVARPEQRPLSEDGIFGPRTEAATRQLERAANVAVDGVAEQETWRALYRLLASRAASDLRTARAAAEWPLPLPDWFWIWARWYLDRGEFAGEPFRSDRTRPDAAPLRIPEWAWRRMTVLNGRSLVSRADHFVEDLIQARFGNGDLSVAQVTVTPQRRSELADGWILLTASIRQPSVEGGPVAAWLRLVRGRWMTWELGRLGRPSYEGEPAFVPCDLKPAFAEAFCAPSPAAGPAAALQRFAAAARAGDADGMFDLLTPAAQQRLGPREAFRAGTATALAEGLGTYPADAEVALAERMASSWAVAAIAAERTTEGTRGYDAYATALSRVAGTWRVALAGPVELEPLEPDPHAELDAIERIALRATAPSPLDTIEVWLDGQPFPTEGGGPSLTQQTEFGQPRSQLAPGRHVVVGFARAGDEANAVAWTFVIAR